MSYLSFSLTRFSKISTKDTCNQPITDSELKPGQLNKLEDTSFFSQATKSEGIILGHRASDQNGNYELASATGLPREECDCTDG